MVTEKIVTELGLRTILEQLYSWLPLIKRNKDVHFGEGDFPDEASSFSIGVENGKIAFDVKKDGTIYIIDINGNRTSLQQAIKDAGYDVDLKMTGYDSIIIPHEEKDIRAYDIKETDDFKLAIKKLDNKYESKIVRATYKEFPHIGKVGTIYKDTETGAEYIWSEELYDYDKITYDVIDAGGANL